MNIKRSRSAQRREFDRVRLEIPIKASSDEGLTRDISVNGIFFEIENQPSVGNEIRCELALRTPVGEVIMECVGEVVRAEASGERTGVAIRITQSLMRIDDSPEVLA